MCLGVHVTVYKAKGYAYLGTKIVSFIISKMHDIDIIIRKSLNNGSG